jgi:glycosidase
MAELYERGIDSLFDFPFSNAEGIIRSVLNKAYGARDFVQAMLSTQEAFSAANTNYADAPFCTNHDMGRSAGYYPNDEGPKTKMAYAMSLLMSGNSFVCYGEEIGMKGSGKDENKRAPMY